MKPNDFEERLEKTCTVCEQPTGGEYPVTCKNCIDKEKHGTLEDRFYTLLEEKGIQITRNVSKCGCCPIEEGAYEEVFAFIQSEITRAEERGKKWGREGKHHLGDIFNCRYCGNEFELQHGSHRYCSDCRSSDNFGRRRVDARYGISPYYKTLRNLEETK